MDLSDKKILVTGCTGLLGSNLVKVLSKKNNVVGISNEATIKDILYHSKKLDIRNKIEVIKIITDFSPNVVIHTAGLTNLDYCENNKKEAWEVNVEGTRNLVLASREIEAKLIYVSTDYVFDGKRGMYKEEEAPNPLNYYSLTKYEGEQIIKELPDHLICRTSVLYGNHPRANFVVWVIRELKQEKRINVVNDQFNSPTLADDLTDMIIELLKKDETGIFHTAGGERINRLDFTKKITEIFDLDFSLVDPISSDKLNWVAKRPMDSSLDVSKVSKIKRPLNIEEGLTRMRGSQ